MASLERWETADDGPAGLGARYTVHWKVGSVPIGGDSSTVNVAAGSVMGGVARFAVTHGPSYRALIDLADLDGSRFIALSGQSGHPLSAHAGDLTAKWRKGTYVPMTMRASEYSSGAIGALRLVPAAPVKPGE